MKNKSILILSAAMVASSAFAGDFTRYVDPFIGTGAYERVDISGNNYPGALRYGAT